MSVRISAIVHTLNEEANIANALRSLCCWVDELVVVDMHSEDRTSEIARAFGARVFLHDRKGSADPARAFAEEQATGEWILVLDADEIIPVALSRELRTIAESDATDICYIPRLNYFGGFPLLHTGWGPEQDRIARFYRKGSFEHLSLIHTHPLSKSGSRVLELPYSAGCAIIHFNYLDVSHSISKLDRYTSIEAIQAIEGGRKVRAMDFLLRPAWEFLNRYLRRGGFRDGWPGLYYSFLMAFYRMTQVMKLRERYTAGSSADVKQKYQAITEESLAQYQTDATAMVR